MRANRCKRTDYGAGERGANFLISVLIAHALSYERTPTIGEKAGSPGSSADLSRLFQRTIEGNLRRADFVGRSLERFLQYGRLLGHDLLSSGN